MMRKTAVLLFFCLVFCSSIQAQIYPTRYRPSDRNWQQLSTSHFNIVFPQGEDSVAWQTARILESQYPEAQQLTGGRLRNFPVILTNYNDRANGFVTSLHFRSEIDIPPIRGKALNPQTGGWLQNVVPHELVHALHFSNLGGVGLGRLVNIFSPDLARSLHGAAPAGIAEGLAVYYESEKLVPGGGRGNYPFFINQFHSIFDSEERWSMGQMVQFPADTRPFNRHYIGGYAFTDWLQQTYGARTSREAISFHIAWPFLGYATALRHATGEWPGELYHKFEEAAAEASVIPRAASNQYTALPLPLKGREVRRPLWLSDSTLIFHGSFYNREQGFYRYHLSSGTLDRIIATGSVPDYQYDLSAGRDELAYSYYEPDLIYPNAYKATLVKYSLDTGEKYTLKNRRLFAPAFFSETSLLALQTHHSTARMVEINQRDTNQLVNTIYKNSSSQLVSMAIHPVRSDTLAIVMNRGGRQGLWITSKNNITDKLDEPPALSFEGGSIFDPAWHPSGHRLLFSSDYSGSLQVYEYDLHSGAVVRLTNAPYNAFEASYSPGGKRIAFVIQKGNERLPVVVARDTLAVQAVSADNTLQEPPGLAVSSVSANGWTQSAYRTGFSWLKPRTLLPVAEEIAGSEDNYRFGAALYSSDLLQQQSYAAEVTTAEERLWYDLSYSNKKFFPGFRARIYSQPSYRRYRFRTEDNQPFTQTFLRQERSFALSIPMQFTLDQNVDFTGLLIEPEVRQSQIRYFNSGGERASDFSNATIANIFGQFNINLRQNIRAVQPHGGWVIYAEAEHYMQSEGLILQTPQGTASFDRSRPTALRAGLYRYLSPLERYNQSLRVGVSALTQTDPLFDNQSVVSEGFSEPVFPLSNNLLSISSRYTIPLFYPDDGGLLLPLYLSNIYLSAFSNTVTDPTTRDFFKSSRTVVGGGLRIRFRISNLSIDIGAGIGWEPSRDEVHYFIGDF